MRYFKVAILAIAAVLIAGALARPARADVSFDLAYSSLSHHGTWLVSAQYGHVWQPSVYNPDWNPYYDGHWVYTDMGWAWVSDYEWGAIPYHYGTWVADPRAGWVWIPGNVWAPAWVVFRTGPDYIGWAPVPPGFSVGVSIEFGGPSSFVFVSSHDFLAPRVRTLIVPRNRVDVIINNTTVVNNIVVQNNVVINRGPDVMVVERATGRSVHTQRIESVARVAPFEHVTRAELAVAPERVKHGVRVDEQVPASRPLPTSSRQQSDMHKSPPASTQKKANEQAPSAQKSHNDTVTPSSSEAKAKTHEQQKKTSDQAAATQKAHNDAATAASNEAKAKTNEQQKKTNEQAAATQKTQAPPQKTKPSAQQQKDAQAKAKAKADADARAKKEQEQKDKDDSGKKTTEQPNNGN